MTLEAFRTDFLPILRTYLQEKADHLNTKAHNETMSTWLHHMVELSQGGKCLRPYLVYTFYRACGGVDEQAMLNMSIFSEIFHLFALVHDDIIDDGKTRHALQTQHKFIEASLKNEHRVGKLEHIAEGQAILVGDLLLCWTADIIARSAVAGMDRDEVQKAYLEMVETVVIGEMLDVDLCTNLIVTSEQITQKTLLKSGHYSMMHPLVLGAAFAGSKEGMELAREVGHHLGLAFQMQDDYLDILGDAKHVGKVLMNDLTEGQHTFFTQYIVERGTESQRELLASLKFKTLSKEEIAQAKDLFESSGALSEGKTIIEQSYSLGQRLVESSDFLAEEPKNDLLALIEKLKNRMK